MASMSTSPAPDARARLRAGDHDALIYRLDAVSDRLDRLHFFHRLGVLAITVPPLRERGRDRLLLLDHFRDVYAAKVAPFTLDEAAERRWLSYSFPGNVRELRNIVIRLGAKYPGGHVGLTALEAELDSAAELVDADSLKALGSGRFRLDDILERVHFLDEGDLEM